MRRAVGGLALCLGLSLAAGAYAQAAGDDEEPKPDESAPSDETIRKPGGKRKHAQEAPAPAPTTQAPPAPGGYHGVAPGGTGLPPRASKMPHKGPQHMTWPGFQVRDGVPTVFFEVTGQPDYTVGEAGGAVVVTLKNTIVPVKNNRRPLHVEFFNTPIKDIDTRAHGHDVLITISHKEGEKTGHREHVEPAAGGYQLLVVELPSADK